MNIPNIIWQTGKNYIDKLPYPYNINILTWQRLNPDHQYNYSDDMKAGREIEQFDSELYELYELLWDCFRGDLWRYVMLYQYGGIYADLDSVALLPFEASKIFNYENSTEMLTPIKEFSGIYNNCLEFDCNECDEFCKIFNVNVYGKEYYAANALFACVPSSIPLKYILDEVKLRYRTFKDLHKNQWNSIKNGDMHRMVMATVDCSVWDKSVSLYDNIISKSFIYGIHAPTDEKMTYFKTNFVPYKAYIGNIVEIK